MQHAVRHHDAEPRQVVLALVVFAVMFVLREGDTNIKLVVHGQHLVEITLRTKLRANRWILRTLHTKQA